MDRKRQKYEEEFRLLLHHTHSLKKPPSYYLSPPELPEEDLEPSAAHVSQPATVCKKSSRQS